ncbi:MAG: ATP-dependent DNA helicase RecG [Verrucomicrobia bacterium]|nr:ATP-dependent DNA helicase RecG [Verrucomicrobiota bacterium]
MTEVLDQPLTDLGWYKRVRNAPLERLGIVTWRDLLEHYPRRHEDRTQFPRFPNGTTAQPLCLRGRVVRTSGRFVRGRKIVEAILEEVKPTALSGRLTCRWFNQAYLQKVLAEGLELIVYGRAKEFHSRIYLDHPEFELIDAGADADAREENRVHLDRITPVYPLAEGVKQRALRALLFQAVNALDDIPPGTILPHPAFKLDRRDAYRQIHFPEDGDRWRAAREELALAEFVSMQAVVERRRSFTMALRGAPHGSSGDLADRFLGRLPYEPTQAQRRAFAEIYRDLASGRVMNRLLQGDVGAGKTLVATVAMLYAVGAGYQAVLMAPTQVLAEQHYRTFSEWLTPLGVKVTLRTANRQESAFLELAGRADIVIGTHALLFAPDELQDVGLVVIDEQHKFGVMQRARLLQHTPVPDLLVMTATPIPRTLAMTVYGDLEVTVLDEKPAYRRPIITRLRSADKVPEAAAFIRDRLAAGRQAYVVYPVIDESEAIRAKAATAEFSRWQKLLAPARCGLLHGRLSAEERAQAMRAFWDGQVQVLVCTSVVEVGIDVPNATVMVIENSERFGLAQLHQLRGRVGRSKHQSYCILLSESSDPEALEKLRILEESDNGFEIAEADLRLRGPGDLLGTAQSGLPPLRLANLVTDRDLIERARVVAAELMLRDPALRSPGLARLRRIVEEAGKTGTGLAN